MQSIATCGKLLLTAAAVVWLVSGGCSAQPAVDDGPALKVPPSEKPIDRMRSMPVTSAAFQQGQPIPRQHTADGEDLSPPLSWSGVPEGTKEFALVCDDPDAPADEPWVHWVIYKIPAGATGLTEGVARQEHPPAPAGAVQGKNSWPDGENLGYYGPAPPAGKPHRYYFRVYALDVELPDQPGLTKRQLLTAIAGHILAEGQLMGTYERKE